MLGTDGFGNLLPFMPIKQDWFFKYRYGFAKALPSDVGSYGKDPYYNLTSSIFGDDDEIVLFLGENTSNPRNSSYSWQIKNSCGYNVRFVFGMGVLAGSTGGYVASVLVSDSDWDSYSNTPYQNCVIDDGDTESIYAVSKANSEDCLTLVMLMLSKS